MFSQTGVTGIMGGGTLEAAESRMQQIETMLTTMRAQSAMAVNPATRVGGGQLTGRLSSASEANAPKPFQFYLQQAQAGEAASPISALGQRAESLQPIIENLSERHGMDKDLINAVIRQESGFNPNAVSKAGATGLMQLMPETARQLGVTNAKDPAQNLDGGIRYLKSMVDQFNGNIPLALAAYNAGSGAVNKYKGVPPYKETQDYVRNILSMYLKSKQGEAS